MNTFGSLLNSSIMKDNFFLRNLDIGLITFICVVNVYVNDTEEVSKLWIDTWIFVAWFYYTFRKPK